MATNQVITTIRVKHAIDNFTGKIDNHLKDMVLTVLDSHINARSTICETIRSTKQTLALALAEQLAMDLAGTPEEYEKLKQLFFERL